MPGPRLMSAVLASAIVPLSGCPKAPPRMTTPVEVDAPRMNQDALAATAAAKEGRSGSIKVTYCVDERGNTDEVKVETPFDADIDALAIETVDGWTFEPATRDDEPYYFCTDVTFDLRFSAPVPP